MLAGTHPRAAPIGTIGEDADDHERLLAFVRAWRIDPEGPSMLRENVESSASWRALDRTFGSLHGAFAYFAKLPAGPIGAARHLLTVKRFEDGPGVACAQCEGRTYRSRPDPPVTSTDRRAPS